jgi:two-component system cell cycle sensor histidine kinase/response regulator CckA
MKARILIVEDESIVQLDLQSRLRRLGHTVVGVASRGDEAIAKAAELAPDLVLMDVQIEGEMNGVEAARRIRSEKPVPIVYVTAYADATEPQDAQQLRPCLAKPFATPELGEAIARALTDANRMDDTQGG